MGKPGSIISLCCIVCVCVSVYVNPCTFSAFAFRAEYKTTLKKCYSSPHYKCFTQSHSEIKAYR